MVDDRVALLELAELRHRNPGVVLEEASAVVRRHPPAAVAAVAHWVVGLAQHELGRRRAAVASYRRALRLADGADPGIAALARAGLAVSLLALGDADGALAEVSSARDLAGPAERGVVEMLHGLVLQRTGQLDAALDAYNGALPRLRRAGDEPSVARLLVNRGVLHAYRGDLRVALSDLTEAEQLSTANGLSVLAAMAAHNTGFAHGRRGNLPDALAALDRARTAYSSLGDPPQLVAVLESDRCELLLVANLTVEAVEAASAAVAQLERIQDFAHRTEARLLLARAHLASGDHALAAAEARRAARSFRAAGRDAWSALAEYVALQADVRRTEQLERPPPGILARTQRIAARLEATGWPVEALHVRTFTGRIALALGRTDEARRALTEAAAARARGTARLRAEAWHATALLALADGDRAGATRAVERGLAVIDEHRAALGATELQAHASSAGIELADTGLRLALDAGKAWQVLRWAERWRAGALRLRSPRPPGDEDLAGYLADLRRLHARVREVTLAGGSDETALTSIRRLENTITARVRQTSRTATGNAPVSALRAVVERVDTRTLVLFVAFERVLHAVVITGGRVRLERVAGLDAVEAERDHLLYAMRRALVLGTDAAVDRMREAAARTDDVVFGPLRIDGDGPIVVVPTGPLHRIPWLALPSLAGRCVTVSPSARLWSDHAAAHTRPAPERIMLVAGPDLAGAEVEVDRLAGRYGGARCLSGAAATVGAVVEHLETVELAHLAAHGVFRSDSPMFSELRLVDGALTVHDVDGLRSTPATVVLPACDAGVAAVCAGDELLGTAAALVGAGVRSVVAPVVPVPDAATARLMLDLHDELAGGAGPSSALARAAATARRGGPLDQLVAASFVCIGADEAS